MKRQKITDLDTIGFIVKLFYSEPEEIKKMAQTNMPVAKVEEIMEAHALQIKKENEIYGDSCNLKKFGGDSDIYIMDSSD